MTRAARAFLVLVSLALTPCVAEAGLTVWRDKNQRGPSQRVDRAVPDLRRLDIDDQISSLAADEPWLVCSEPRYRGECRVIDGTVENLHGSGMNDRISSLRPAPQGRARGWDRRYGVLEGRRTDDRYGSGREDDRDDARYDRDDPRYDRDDPRHGRGTDAVIRVYANEDYRGTSQTFDRAVLTRVAANLENAYNLLQEADVTPTAQAVKAANQALAAAR